MSNADIGTGSGPRHRGAAAKGAFCVGKCADGVLFPINDHIVRHFDRDIRKAGVEKRTAEGKIDFHALRVTFGTLLLEIRRPTRLAHRRRDA